jgi:pantothenate synthetase
MARKILGHLKGVSFIRTAAVGLMLRLTVCPEVSVTDYRHTPRNIPEERNPQQHSSASLCFLPKSYRLYIKKHKVKTDTWK